MSPRLPKESSSSGLNAKQEHPQLLSLSYMADLNVAQQKPF